MAHWHPDPWPASLQPGLRGKGTRSKGREKPAGIQSGNIHGRSRAVRQEEKSLALDAKHVCTRMGFKNSNRTLSVFKDLCERFVCPKP